MKVENGDTVIVIYDGQTETGEVFESSNTSGPMEFVIGTEAVLPGFEKNIVGMTEGETKSFTLTPEEAHGSPDQELIHTIDRKNVNDSDKIQVGMVLGLNHEHEGQQHKVPATVTAINDSEITVDFNHPLAGQSLTYQVTVQSVVKPQPE